MRYADTNYDNIYSAGIFGDMYVSEIPSAGTFGTVNWDIVSYAINAGDRGWGGTGSMLTYSNGSLETRITLQTPMGQDLVTGHADYRVVGWNDPTVLPAELHWPGFGWYYGDQYFAQILSLDMTRVSASVPEPPMILLLVSGLIGLFAVSKRKNV